MCNSWYYSTLSSGLNSLAALTLEDFVKPYVRNITEFKSTVLAKLLGTGEILF